MPIIAVSMILALHDSPSRRKQDATGNLLLSDSVAPFEQSEMAAKIKFYQNFVSAKKVYYSFLTRFKREMG